jgi:indolepyruvate ferredoxin oxidoreductase, beta subunit
MDNMTQPIKIAILAMGGEGGGVLADWIVALGEHNGFIAQTTSVPGVAQRTGATIYYVELFSREAADAAGAAPVLALMPLPGDVDIVLASELMEAGRAVQRGLVTPDRTTLVASTHRVYAMSEKVAMGDGRSDSAALLAQAQAAAQRFVGYDMALAAENSHSVISAVLFGALAGTGVLPFAREQFEATVRQGGVGVKASLAAFGKAFERVASGAVDAIAEPAAATAPPVVPRSAHPAVQALLDEAARRYAGQTLAIVIEGLRRLVDYQDPAYADMYLRRLGAVHGIERERDPASTALTREVARHLALWMSYEDTIRVADLKTRDSRFARVRGEVRVGADQVLTINEYMHPRLQEIADTLPAGVGRWLLRAGTARRLVERLASKGRVIQTSSLRGYLMLSAVASLRRWRRATLRFAEEHAQIDTWLADIREAAATDFALAVEIARCQRLVKGYGDTHERGLRNFTTLRGMWKSGAPAIAPSALASLRDAALADDQGIALRAAMQRLAPNLQEG